MLPFLIPALIGGGLTLLGLLSDDDSSGTTKTVSGPSENEVKDQKRKGIYDGFKNDVVNLWRSTDYLLCVKDKTSFQDCFDLPQKVREGENTPNDALGWLHQRELPKDNAKLDAHFSASRFLNNTPNNVTSFVAAVNRGKYLDDPYMLKGDNYDLCQREYWLECIQKALATHKAGDGTASLPNDLLRRHDELNQLWQSATMQEEAWRQSPEPCIVVCGLLKAGKSSLLNSLFDDMDDALFPVGVTRKTSENKMLVKDGLRFVDTPGLDANSQDTEEAQKAYLSADMLLFVHNAERELIAGELDLLRSLQDKCDDLGKRLVVVVSHADVAGDHLNDLLQKIKDQLQDELKLLLNIYPVSNKRYRSTNEMLRHRSGIDELRILLNAKKDEIQQDVVASRRAKADKVYGEIRKWVTTYAHAVRSDRKHLDRDMDFIFSHFKDNVIEPAQKLLREIQ